jgi:hypothetical protein
LLLGGMGGAGPAPKVRGTRLYCGCQWGDSQWARGGFADSFRVLGDPDGVVAMITEASEARRYWSL